MTGIGIVNLIYARQLMHWAVGASVMMNEIAASYDDFMSELLNEAKRHEGQQEIARMMRQWVEGSQCVYAKERMNFIMENTKRKSSPIRFNPIIRCAASHRF